VHENHNIDEQTYKHYTENMRLTEEEINFVNEMIQAGANKQKIKNMLMERRGGRPVSLKSIHNVQTKFKREIEQLIAEETELEKLLANMNKIPNARIKVSVNEDNELLGILFQDERMARIYEKYPELLLIDATYKLNNRRIPLFILLVVDGNGESEIACLWFIKSESKECISPMIDSFKELNSSWTKTKVIISDKDLSERVVFSEKFNGIPIQICLFHTLRNFNREITTAKRGITAAQREVVLEILVKMAYSRSSLEYDSLYTELCNLKLPEVTKYFDENWHTIRSEWTLHGKNEWNNYMNYTNNRVESLNQKIKIIGNHYATLLSFFDNVVQSYSVISSERDIKVIKSSMKVVRQRFDDIVLQRYNEFLTSYVFEKVLDEYKKSEKVPFVSYKDAVALTKYGRFQEVFTKEDTCTCGFYKTMHLPCRHIFQFR
jgi:zinc finger SWIM domain-containing protein 3